jgi:hypothetical protein
LDIFEKKISVLHTSWQNFYTPNGHLGAPQLNFVS